MSEATDVVRYLERYRSVISTIILAHGVRSDDVGEVFRRVESALLAHAPSDAAAAATAITTAARQAALDWRRRHPPADDASPWPDGPLIDVSDFDDLGLPVSELDVIEAMRELPRRCQILLWALLGGIPDSFFAETARLHVAGSIGPMRARCLVRLRENLRRAHETP
jgi:hypothetical protein